MNTSASAPNVIAVVGATATGKSALAVDLALALNGEVINADSMQFYRGMDIGTAKVTADERRGVEHHQLDTLDVSDDATVAGYQRAARADIDAIHARGKRAIVVGGSGLYIRALLDRFEFQPTDPATRARLEARAEIEGPGILHRELAAVDPVAAAKIQPQNAKRIVRALEVIELTGGEVTSSLPQHVYEIPAIQLGIELPYEALDPRIEARVNRMWERDLVGETQRLVGQGLRDATTARRAVGYAETLAHIDGDMNESETVALIKQHTRRLARKQQRWFKPDPRVTWLVGASGDDDTAVQQDQERLLASALEALRSLDA